MNQAKKEWDIFEWTAIASKFIETHFKKALVISAVLVIGAGLFSYKKSLDRESELKAFSELYKITKGYNKKKADFAEAKKALTQKKEEPQKEKEPLTQASGDMQKDYGQDVTALESFIASHQNKNAAGEAALILSEIYSEYKKPEKGAEALTQVLKSWDDKNVLYYVMNMRAGDLWASAGQCPKATPYWQSVAEGKSFIAEQAGIKLGICLQNMGQIDEAKKHFEKIVADSPNSSEGFSAKRYIRFLEFKGQPSNEEGENKAQQKPQKQDKKS